MEVNTSPVKVAMVAACPFPANHGTPGAIRELALHLLEQGHEVHVVTYPQAEDIDVNGLIIHRVNIPFMKPGPVVIGPSLERLLCDIFLVPKLVQVIRKHKIDIIHAHNYEANIAGALARLLTRKPLIYNAVTMMGDELPSYNALGPDWLARGIGKFLDKTVPRMSDLIMVLSDELKDDLIKCGNPERKVLIVPPGVELAWLSSGNRQTKRQKLGIAPSTQLIIYTGALEAFQRVDILISAMAKVRANGKVKLFIVSNIKNEKASAALLAQVDALGIGDKVVFEEEIPLTELPDYLAAADIAVVPRPNCPGYPIKLLNYMAAGKAIVSFAGSAKSLFHGYSGFVAKDANIESLAEGIQFFIDNPDAATEMGRRARTSLENVFDWPTLAAGVGTTYIQLMKDRKRCPRAHLTDYFKQSYTPTLEKIAGDSRFITQGKLSYPALRFDQN